MDNKELSDIITIIGLQWGQKNDVSKLNFHKIVIATDADNDGYHIRNLVMTFFFRQRFTMVYIQIQISFPKSLTLLTEIWEILLW